MPEPTFTPHLIPTEKLLRSKAKVLLGVILFFLFCVVAVVYAGYTLNKAPTNFKASTSFTVEPGEGVKTITAHLQEASLVRSKALLYFVLTLRYDTKSIKASTYIFDRPMTTVEIAKKLVIGDFSTDLIKFTHIEGERAAEVATHAQGTLTNFDSKHFLERAVPLEGKLYPETYLIPKTFSADQLIDLMLKTFDEKTKAIQPKMESYTLSPKDILILASILEREANSPESMRVVSGILQRRLKEGIRLQADASIEYVLNKPLKELTAKDLEIESPYNTYRKKGLPPTPIGNPGLDAITAVIEPTPSEYTYYITDNEGNFHYAKTYKEHLANVAKYLR